MSSIPDLLRQLAAEIEKEEIIRRTNLETRFDDLYEKVADVDIRAHNNKDKLQKIGKILMED